jgi:hypothetical protein
MSTVPATQLETVAGLMADGRWRTLSEIAAVTRQPGSSVSARLRDFRKKKYGGRLVERRRRSTGSGTYEYRMPPRIEPTR